MLRSSWLPNGSLRWNGLVALFSHRSRLNEHPAGQPLWAPRYHRQSTGFTERSLSFADRARAPTVPVGTDSQTTAQRLITPLRQCHLRPRCQWCAHAVYQDHAVGRSWQSAVVRGTQRSRPANLNLTRELHRVPYTQQQPVCLTSKYHHSLIEGQLRCWLNAGVGL